MRCGLLGEKLKHSYSPQIHNFLGNYSYELFEKEPSQLADFLLNGDYDGLNVTIPYKKAVLPFCHTLSNRARITGAVNTIVRKPDGSLTGHNTDYYGFESMLERSGLCVSGKKVLVLGSGGASVTVTAVLRDRGALPVIISRTGANNYNNIYLHSDAAVIVNTTPVGMYPEVGTSLLTLDIFPELEGVLDLIYNPARTNLIMDAEAKGLLTMSGLWMLVAQAKESAEYFLGYPLPDQSIESTYYALLKQTENYVLIGMPGCGKSTVGRYLAQITGKRFVDSDNVIMQRCGITIPAIFQDHGEDYFRSLESSVLEEFGKESGLVIATGGGCVLRKENYCHLHRNGRIIWLKRDIAHLPIDGRPLSQANTLQNLYALRKPLYESFADHTVFNNAAPEEVANTIAALEVWK